MELRRIIVAGREPRLWLAVLLMLVASAIAYASPFQYALHIGGAAELGNFARPYLLGGFNRDRERSSDDSPTTFRWAFGNAHVALPGIGSAPRNVTLRVVTGQPTTPVPSTWTVGGVGLLTLPLRSDARQYHVFVPASESNFDLGITTPTFVALNDPRDLAFATDGFEVTSFRGSVPPISILWVVVSVAFAYLLMRRWNVSLRITSIICVVIVVCLGVLLAYQRLGVTTFAPRLAPLLGAAYVGTVLLAPLLEASARLLGIAATSAEAHNITALVMLAWIIRLGGLLHPQAYTNDLGLHVNNLRGVVRGEVIFTEALPGEAGGGPAPYPPAQYVMLLPFAGLADAGIVLQIGTTLADSLVIVWGWLLLRAAGAPAGAALWAGGMYLFALPLLRSLLVGEVANVWGQAFVGPMMLALWWWERRPATSRPRSVDARQSLASLSDWIHLAWVPGVCVVVALLGHFGVFLSLLVFFATYAAILLLGRGPWLRLSLLVAWGVAITIVLYYSAHAGIILDSPERVSVPFGVGRVWGELRKALMIQGLIGPLAFVLGVTGLVIVVRRLPQVRALMLGWWVSTLVSLGALLWTQQALRWTAFLFPAVAWSGGVALHTLAARGRTGRALACAALTALLIWGAVLWYSQIVSYNH